MVHSQAERAEAAEALREQEKVWPNDAEKLRKVAKDFRSLADRATQQAEAAFCAESERVLQRAEEGNRANAK